MSGFLRRAARAVALLVAVLALPAGFAVVSATAAFGAYYAPGPERTVPAAAPVRHDPAKPTAVVVVGALGAEVSDTLAPYEILAATNRFNVYTVGPQRRPVPLTGGLDLVPDLTFDQLAGLAAPALVVVPALPDLGEPTTAPVTDWVRAQADRGAQLLSICNGAGVLASAGLLDGRPAAAHWMQLRGMQAAYPHVRWVPGQRFVDDGDVVSTAGILSGVDGTLHVVERLLGPAAARGAAAAVGWEHDGSTSVHTGFPVPDPAAILNAGFRLDPPTVGVALTDGVGEIELASVFNSQARSLATRTLAVTDDGGPVRSRHGLTFLPRADLAGAAPRLDRLIVPGGRAMAPVAGGPEPEYVHVGGGFAFDATVTDLARSTDTATARWVAKVLELPADGLPLDGPAWPWGPTTVLVVLTLPGLLLHQIITKILDRRGGRHHTQSPWWTQPRPKPNPNSSEPSVPDSCSSSWSATSSERGSTP
jgi:transcriptional regulator GlxA family with amidase domain